MSKVVAIVPIKMNNERVPGKNTRLLGNKPLTHYMLNTLLEVDELDEIYVFCSNPAICEYLPDGIRYLERSPELDSANTNFTQIFESFIEKVQADIYVCAHVTSPFIRKETISKGIKMVLSGEYDSAFTAEKLQEFIWYNSMPLNFDPANIPRSQDLIPVYKETTGVYVYSRDVFARHRRRVGLAPYAIEVNKMEQIDINTQDDFDFAEMMIRNG